MQKVGVRTAVANAQFADAPALPALLARTARAVSITVSHAWVLHRLIMVRAFAALLVMALAAGAWQAREYFVVGVHTLSQLVQGKFADAGFGISQIEITGQTLTGERAIVDALALDGLSSTLNFDADAARERLEALPAVASATVQKIYPGHLIVEIVEKVPVARWRFDGATSVIDATGASIGSAGLAYGDLPLIVGEGAADDALPMIRALSMHTSLEEGLYALSRIADRRWDLIYDSGLRVQLPEHGVGPALDHLVAYQRDYALMDRDLSLIDLRVPGTVAVQLVDRNPADDEAE